MAKINSKIDQALRKEVIENGVLLGTVLIFGFNDNLYLYENEVYVEQFKLTDDDYVVTDFYRGSWEVINTNIYNGKFNANEPYAEALIDYMNLYNRSLYLGNKKYREIAKEQFVELKKDYQESGLLDDINALLKKSKSKTFRYSKYESKKNVGKSLKEAQYNSKLNRGKGYDVLSWILLDIAEWGEKVIHKDCTIEDGHGGIIFRGRLYEYYIRTRYTDNLTSFDVKYDAWEDLCNDYMTSGFHDKSTPIEIQQLLHKKELWELIEVADWFIGEQNIIELKPTRELVNWAEKNYNYV